MATRSNSDINTALGWVILECRLGVTQDTAEKQVSIEVKDFEHERVVTHNYTDKLKKQNHALRSEALECR